MQLKSRIFAMVVGLTLFGIPIVFPALAQEVTAPENVPEVEVPKPIPEGVEEPVNVPDEVEPINQRRSSSATCSYVNPITASSRRILSRSGTVLGLIELRYSRTCRTAWARLTSYMPGCRPGDIYCGHAEVRRNNSNLKARCPISQRGQTSCYTPALDDRNVTSYAYGELDNGNFYSATTDSY